MKRAYLCAAVLLAACHTTPPPAAPGSTAGLEARVKKLEETNAKYAEALEMLQQVYAKQKAQAEAEEENTLADDGVWAVEIADDVKAGQVDGPATAGVTIIKAFDFACPYCNAVAKDLEEIVKDRKGDVRVVYKNMIIHPAIATQAHLASCAAAKQGKYLAFKSAFWDKAFKPYAEKRDPTQLGEANIMAIAKDLKLDTKRLETDMASDECRAHIAADMSELEKFHVDSTPTFFINGHVIAGALPKDQFDALIDIQLAAVKASGIPAGEYYDKVVMAKGEHVFRSKKDKKKTN